MCICLSIFLNTSSLFTVPLTEAICNSGNNLAEEGEMAKRQTLQRATKIECRGEQWLSTFRKHIVHKSISISTRMKTIQAKIDLLFLFLRYSASALVKHVIKRNCLGQK